MSGSVPNIQGTQNLLLPAWIHHTPYAMCVARSTRSDACCGALPVCVVAQVNTTKQRADEEPDTPSSGTNWTETEVMSPPKEKK